MKLYPFILNCVVDKYATVKYTKNAIHHKKKFSFVVMKC